MGQLNDLNQRYIGVYKVGAPICWNSGLVNDMNGFCYETTKLCDLFAKFGNDVTLLSRYSGFLPELVHDSKNSPEHFDAIYVVAGNHDFDLNGEEIYTVLRKRCSIFCLVQTDSVMKVRNASASLFDVIYTQQHNQSYPEVRPKKELYSGMPEITLFGEKILDKEKRHKIIFGGSERQRLDKIVEYVFRPEVTSYLKIPSMDIMTRLSYPEFQDEFARSKYTIVIPSSIDTSVGHITPKVYDAVRMGVIPLIDKDYDKKDMLGMGDIKEQLTVKNYMDMREKVQYFESHPQRREMIMEILRSSMMKPEFFDGSYTYKCLTEVT